MKNIGQFSRIEMLFNFPGQLLIELLLKTFDSTYDLYFKKCTPCPFFSIGTAIKPFT